MAKYKTLLFDLDNTLLDFDAAEKMALEMLFSEHYATLTPEIETIYQQINQSLWRSYEEGKISREEVLHQRFTMLFKELGKDLDGAKLDDNYRNYLQQGFQLVEGAMELVQSLYQTYDLFIITNGVLETQKNRLKGSGLEDYFKDVFISDEIGYQKPMMEFFDYVKDHIPGFSKEAALVIGDSLSADIKGGNLANMDTCWVNLKGLPNHEKIVPTYEIRKLEELKQILKS